MSITIHPCFTTFYLFTTLICKGAFTNIVSDGYRRAEIQNNNLIVAASSLAGYTSNDQISSNVKFYTTPGINIKKNGDTMTYTYPINNNRGIATGSIQMKPGSVSISSSSYTKSPTYNYWPNIPRLDPITPMFNRIYPPIKLYQPPNIEPWFFRNMINNMGPLKPVFINPFIHQNLDQLSNLWQ